MKKKGLLQTKHESNNENKADLFTKNLPGRTFKKHAQIYCGADK